jgi:hypothetical protein
MVDPLDVFAVKNSELPVVPRQASKSPKNRLAMESDGKVGPTAQYTRCRGP